MYVYMQCQQHGRNGVALSLVGTRKDEETKEIDDTLDPSRSSRWWCHIESREMQRISQVCNRMTFGCVTTTIQQQLLIAERDD